MPVNGNVICCEGSRKNEYYYNGKISSIGSLTNGKRTGLWKYYHENGQLKSIGNIDNVINNQTGEWKFYNEKEELTKKITYDVNGKEIKNY